VSDASAPDELAALRDEFPGYRFRRQQIRGVACYLAEASGDAVARGDAEAPRAAARSPAVLAAMLAAAAGRPLRLRPQAVAAAYCDRLLTVRQCAEMFGVSRTTIVKLLVDQGIVLRRAGDGLDEEAVVRAYRDDGLSLAECGAHFGISPRRVTALLDRHDVPRRPAGRPARPRS
jgi:hypothetical protein